MASFVQDTMAGTDGTVLTSHVGSVGATWTQLTASGSESATIFSNTLFATGGPSDEAYYYASGSPANADYQVALNYLAMTEPRLSNNIGCYPLLRVNTSSGSSPTAYVAFRSTNASLWYIAKYVSGVLTLLAGTTPGIPLTPGATYALIFKIVGTTLTLSVNGTIILTITDSSISSAGKAGIVSLGNVYLNFPVIYDYVASDVSSLVSGTTSATIASGTSVALAVTAASGGTGPYNYQFQRAPDVAGSPGSFANVGPNSTSLTYTNTGLTTRTPYWYQCVTTDANSNTVPSNAVNIIPGVATAFYVNSVLGNDSNPGTSAGSGAWLTLAHVSSITNFIPGDSISLTSGQTFPGTLTITNSGIFGALIEIGTTGAGAATIHTTVATDPGIVLQDCEFVSVNNLTMTGPGVSSTGTHTASGADSVAVLVKSTKTSTGPSYYSGIRISNLTISGYLTGNWVRCTAGTAPVNADPTDTGLAVGYADYRVNGVTIINGGSHGFRTDPPSYNQGAYFFTGIYFGNSTISNIYGDVSNTGDETGTGYKLTGVFNRNDIPTTENIVVSDCGAHCSYGGGNNGPVGGFFFICEGCLMKNIQVNRQKQGINADGEGLGFDGGCINCVMDGCATRDCVGSSVYAYKFAAFTTTGNVVRNHISCNDANGTAFPVPIFTCFNSIMEIENATVYSDATTLGRNAVVMDDEIFGCRLTNCVFVMLNGSKVQVNACRLYNNLYWYGSTGALNVNIGFADYTTLAGIHSTGYEIVNTNPTGYNQDPGLSAPVPGQSCAQLISAWTPSLTGILVDGGITPPVVL